MYFKMSKQNSNETDEAKYAFVNALQASDLSKISFFSDRLLEDLATDNTEYGNGLPL